MEIKLDKEQIKEDNSTEIVVENKDENKSDNVNDIDVEQCVASEKNQHIDEVDKTDMDNSFSEEKRVTSKEIIAYLSEKFPECFSLKGVAKPLKIGIFQDLAEKLEGDSFVSKTRLRQALRHYTSSWRYLRTVKVGVFRVDIEGNDVEKIDEDQADYASKTLKESQAKFIDKNPKTKDKSTLNQIRHTKKKTAEQKNKKEKFSHVKSSKQNAKKPTVKLKPVESQHVSVGKSVKVQLGQSSMDATITEVSGNDVSVQLTSGMVVKTQIKNIFTE